MEEEKNVVPTNETKVEASTVNAQNETSHAPSENRRPRGERKFDRRNDKKRGDRREQVKEFEERVVYINRVCKTVKGGRRMKFSALVVIGNHKGKYGFRFCESR